MSKVKQLATVCKQERLATDVYSMWIETEIAKEAQPGQFISVYTRDASRLLPRPISICEIGDNQLRIVYRIVGDGTREFATYRAGNSISILGPLGNGFPLLQEDAILIGGGIGIPPMLALAQALQARKEIVLGYRDERFLTEEFEKFGQVTLATEDGSAGTKGTVMDAIREQGITGSVIYACGPKPMLRSVQEYADTNRLTAYLSMEERMACGVGACLACVCKTKKIDDHSKVHNTRICADGPVFNAREVDLS